MELLEAKAGTEDDTGSGCCVAWESHADSNPYHSTSPCQLTGGVQRQQSNPEGARLWPALSQALPQLMLGTGLGLPVTPVN